MKKTLVALALTGICAGAYAQSSVTIYGTIDTGVTKRTNTTLSIGKRDNNKLGFKGVEDLGDGLSALYQLEIRYEPDTGAIEGTTATTSRPLFQGQSRVGLQGSFGTVRLGRGLTAFQESIVAFEPWNGVPSVAGFLTDVQVAGYTSDPLSPVGNSANRFSNAMFYNSPVLNGFQLNATVATKEANGGPVIIGQGTALAPQFPANSMADTVPYSLSATYNNGPLGVLAGYERNGIDTRFWSLAASYKPITPLKLMASYQRQNQSDNVLINPVTSAWVVGANYLVGPGKILIGYGHKMPDNVLDNPALAATKQASLGYEYSLSVRTYLYIEGSNKRAATTLNFYALGIHHNF